MDPTFLKQYLIEELHKYNYVIGLRLLIIFINNLKILHSDDEKSAQLLEDFINFFKPISQENIKDGFNILLNIENIKIIVDLLCFFNPREYHYLRREISKIKN